MIQNREELGVALTALRLRAGLTIRDLAARAGLPNATVGGYVTAKHLPGPSQTEQFRAVLIACGVVDRGDLHRWDEALLRVRVSSDGRSGRRGLDGAGPYRGLEPFQPDDADLFFGREAFVGQVLSRLTELWLSRPAGEAVADGDLRLLFVIGASGSGKSSVLRAGVLPAVLDGAVGAPVGVETSGHNWSATIMVPGRDPFAALDQALAATTTPRLLIIDQFEELYTHTVEETEQARFVARLGSLGPDTLIVAGMRADFFPAAARDAMLVPSLQAWQMVVPPMSEAELRSAVVGPAAAWNIAVDDALVEAVMADVFPFRAAGAAARQNALPLLSHALLSAWEHRKRGRLTLADYRAAGGLGGAVQQSAEEACAGLTVAEQEFTRRIFLRLVNVDEDLVTARRRISHEELDELDELDDASAKPVVSTRSEVSRSRAAWSDAGLTDVTRSDEDRVDAAELIERFVARRLVTVDEGHVEVSHDALLTAWPRLADWIAADHAGLRVHRRLTSAANAWQAADFDDQGLIRGPFLGAAEEWSRDPDHLADMNRLERDFLTASVRSRDAEHRAAQRRTSVLRRLVAAFAALLLVAVVSAGYALHASDVAGAQQRAASLARNDALSREVAIESTRAAATDPALAQQLALAAYRISPTVDARSALLDTTAPGIVNRLVGASGPTTLRLNPAGSVLAVSDAQTGAVNLYRYASDRPGSRLGTVPADASADQVFALAFSPDGRTLAVGGVGGKVRLFEVADPTNPVLIATAPGSFGGAVEAVAFNPSGTQLAAGGVTPPLRVWNTSDPHRPQMLPAPAESGGGDDIDQTVAFSPDGRLLAAGSAGAVRLWPSASMNSSPVTTRLGIATVDVVLFAPDGKSFIAGSKDGTAAVVEVGGHAPTHQLATGFTSWVNSAAYSPDGQLLALGGSNGAIDVFDAGTMALIDTIVTSSQVTAVQYSADGRTLISASADGVVRSWAARRGTISGLSGPVFAVGYDRGGSRLALSSTGSTGGVSLWSTSGVSSAGAGSGVDRRSPVEVGAMAIPPSFGASDGTVAISPDGRLAATGNHAGQVLLDPVTETGAFGGSPVALNGATKIIEAIAFSPDAHTVAASSDDGFVRLWDVTDAASPKKLPDLDSHGEAASIAFSPDGRYLAAASVDRTVHLWDVSDPAHAKPLPSLPGFDNYAWSVAFSPDSKMLAGGGADDTIRLWNIADPQHPQLVAGPMNGPRHYVFGLAFSPDGATLAASGGDGSVWTWSVPKSGPPTVLTMLHGANPGGSTYAIAYSPDGETLAAAGTAAEVFFWNIDAESVVAAMCVAGGDNLGRAEWTQYVPDYRYQDVCS